MSTPTEDRAEVSEEWFLLALAAQLRRVRAMPDMTPERNRLADDLIAEINKRLGKLHVFVGDK